MLDAVPPFAAPHRRRTLPSPAAAAVLSTTFPLDPTAPIATAPRAWPFGATVDAPNKRASCVIPPGTALRVAFREFVFDLAAVGVTTLVCDMTGVTFLESADLGQLLSSKRCLERAAEIAPPVATTVTLANVSAEIRSMFEQLSLTALFALEPAVPGATS